jgi:hypothetical protein
VGQPRIASQSADHIETSTIAWEYDNTRNTEDFSATWSETWTNTTSAALSISNRGRWCSSWHIHDPLIFPSRHLVEPKYYNLGRRQFRIFNRHFD